MTNLEFSRGLNQLAMWYASNPDVPQITLPIDIYAGDGKAGKAALVNVAKSFPTAQKDYNSDTWFHLCLDFAPNFRVRFWTGRSTVCTKQVIGTRTIPGKHVPASAAYDEEDREEEIIQWVCEPLLQEEVVANE